MKRLATTLKNEQVDTLIALLSFACVGVGLLLPLVLPVHHDNASAFRFISAMYGFALMATSDLINRFASPAVIGLKTGG
ncbi:MAG: hypothetical protein A3A28_00490 [Candidatus Sungbacteria bacterium RIFCSPLOWO2_01_FULL_47_32]|uniref:Uncharacterized protein n=1 Tax=Candidatus Sungbacteria bacterium RIFCSPHIGHO2_01_FULL_47_32 TaxID=1802264 RepID=A0A1G2K8F7_9BACT|nr:MAG: hypothetical protein A2633_01910 [Candidatus Sungbacteria bacterium RIFCSPHIGHO2_01_FULL_47_32]OGZ98241.1 MAG: hypothetical protein A3D57_05125 [Candidatus Sungbacteria bacterium RIFCSPHIGHO2_02_FULL_46_12]OHA05337.1 MAG: hypothetical protein A3A28_00490 [Candidatus Sungbacteria bacterium RIFCSPLOWO2_01_FULL_47_32]